MNYNDDLTYMAFEEGRKVGYYEGSMETELKFQAQLQIFNSELITLNARVEILEKLTGGFK